MYINDMGCENQNQYFKFKPSRFARKINYIVLI